jgi:hypothetical protein
MRSKNTAAFAACALAFVSLSVSATDYTTEYDKKIKSSQNVGVLGNDLAGDRVNFYTGATSFSATDVSAPGNAMSATISRTFVVEYNHMMAAVKGTLSTPQVFSSRKRLFGDWDLDVPHISTTMSQSDGWIVSSTTPEKRCSLIGQVETTPTGTVAASGRPPTAYGTRGYSFGAHTYWSGYTLHAGGDQSLLLASLPNNERPSSGGPYHWTTNQNWWVSCLGTLANASATNTGEGFLVRSPDGMTYTFDWLSKRNIDAIEDPDEYTERFPEPAHLFRAEYLMLPTRVVDRFGNWTTYTWSNDEFARLIEVNTGPKGMAAEQTIKLTYTGELITKIVNGDRVWKYVYATAQLGEPLPYEGSYPSPTLSEVTLPDGSKWKYGLAGLGGEPQVPVCTIDENIPPDSPEYQWACWGGGDVYDSPEGGYVIHPSGAKVTFGFINHFQSTLTSNASYPLGLASKTITGVGLSDATWKYEYLMTKDKSRAACLDPNFGCPTTVVTDQINPDKSVTRRLYGLGSADETLLLSEFDGSVEANGGGSPVVAPSGSVETAAMTALMPNESVVPTWYRKTNYTRVTAANPGYVVKVGVNPVYQPGLPSQVYASERRLPIRLRELTQQGVVFTTETTTFDKYARPKSVTRRSAGAASGNFTRTETTAYDVDRTLTLGSVVSWVPGQVISVSEASTGKVMSSTVYDASTALPVSTSTFGQPPQVFEYFADGTLKSVTDALLHKTSLSGWYRGIPGTITYPTVAGEGAISESAIIAPDGTIQSTTDEVSYTTSYGYDPMGRLNAITYPSGGAPTWNSLARSLTQENVASEFGVAPGHWKQTVQVGSAKTTTIYDARWQPVLTLTEITGVGSSQSFVVRRFDSMGRESFRSYPVTSATVNSALTGVVTEYDALGRVVKVKQDADDGSLPIKVITLTTTTEYPTGFQTRVTNPRSKVTTTSYQVFDAPSTDAPVRIDAPEGVTTVISRDAFGKPRQVTRSGPGG